MHVLTYYVECIR